MSYEMKDFQTDVLDRSHQVPVLVDFWAPWCGPCKILTPVIEKLAQQAAGRWELVKVNTEEHPDLAQAYAIASIPNVKLFHQGEVINEFFGAQPEPEILRWLDAVLPSALAPQVDNATQFVEAGRIDDAIPLLRSVLESEPGNEPARLLLARAYLSANPAEVEKVLTTVGEDSDRFDQAQGLRFLAGLILSARQPDTLPEGPARARYLEGAKHLEAQHFEEALQAFLDILERHRDYSGGVAKDACKAIFQVLGIRHPISEKYFRAFSSALYS